MEGRFVSAEKTRISAWSPGSRFGCPRSVGTKPPAVSGVAGPALRMLNQRYRPTNSSSVYASLRMAKSDKSGLPFPGSRHSGMVPIQVLPNLWLSVSFIVFRVSNQSTDFPNSWLIASGLTALDSAGAAPATACSILAGQVVVWMQGIESVIRSGVCCIVAIAQDVALMTLGG
jgi:hypothetical protein